MDANATTQRQLSTRQRVSRRIHLVLAAAFGTAAIVQIFFAGAGVFSGSQYLARHVAFVEWFQPIPVFLVATALLGKMSWFSRVAPAAAWLGIVLQYEFAKLSPSAVAGLHVVNGFLIAWLAVETTRKAWTQRPGAA